MTDRFKIRIGELDPIEVVAKNRRSALNKAIEGPEAVAIVQDHVDSAGLYRVHREGRAERIGSISRVAEKKTDGGTANETNNRNNRSTEGK